MTDPNTLATELDEVSRTGYALEDQESALGDGGIAAPVFDRSGVAGAIGIIGPVDRVLDEATRQDHIAAVREVARQISRELGAGRGGVRAPRP